MRIIGIDLAVRSAHKAVVIDEGGHNLTRVIEFHTDVRDLALLLGSARRDDPDCELWVVMEPTGMAWFPIAAYFTRQSGIRLFLVNAQQVADLRRFYKRHAKSDRIDARLLARLPLINGEQLHELVLPSAVVLACQRSCKQLDRLEGEITALKNRILAADRFAWPGLEELVFPDPNITGKPLIWIPMIPGCGAKSWSNWLSGCCCYTVRPGSFWISTCFRRRF
jgi:transposase